jgi:hypothetical protein
MSWPCWGVGRTSLEIDHTTLTLYVLHGKWSNRRRLPVGLYFYFCVASVYGFTSAGLLLVQMGIWPPSTLASHIGSLPTPLQQRCPSLFASPPQIGYNGSRVSSCSMAQ